MFPESFALQLAVYWSKPDDDILGIIHSLLEMGIPFFVTRDLDRALQHRLVIIYPAVDSRTFTEGQVAELKQHIQDEGSIFAVNVFAGSLKDLFGFSGYEPSHRRYRVDFAPGSDAMLRYVNRPEELEVRLGDPKSAISFGPTATRPNPQRECLRASRTAPRRCSTTDLERAATVEHDHICLTHLQLMACPFEAIEQLFRDTSPSKTPSIGLPVCKSITVGSFTRRLI